MKIVADLHTHTNASDHAVSTFEEMISGAKRKGHIAIAFTNHAPLLGDAPHPWHFGTYSYIPKCIDGVYIIGGVEVNITPEGEVDFLPDMRKLDYVIASLHEPVFGVPKNDTHIEETLMKILENPNVTTFGHLGTPCYKFDYEKIISKCNEYKKIVEINTGSFKSRGSFSNCKEIALLCKKHSVPIAITSDAHSSYSIGDVSEGIDMLCEIGYDENLIINISKENLDRYFKEYRGIDIFNRK